MPDEIARPVFPSEPKLGLAPVAIVERSPTGLALLPQVAVKVAAVIVALATVGLAVFGMLLPAPWAATGLAICTAIVGLGATLGIVSPGARSAPGAAPVVESPRVGPPV